MLISELENCSAHCKVTLTPVTLLVLGSWSGIKVMFSVGNGYRKSIIMVAQLLLVGHVHDSADEVVLVVQLIYTNQVVFTHIAQCNTVYNGHRSRNQFYGHPSLNLASSL